MQSLGRVNRAVAPSMNLAIRKWLREEVRESSANRNAFMDDYDRMRETLWLPPDDPENLNALKFASHSNRIKKFTANFEESQTPTIIARQLFVIQMKLSALDHN